MKEKLMEILACPYCKVKLKMKIVKKVGDEIMEGTLFCYKCQKCGYNKYIGALEIHHLNPEEKESNHERQKKNLDITNLVLLCSNCHRGTRYKVNKINKEVE